MSKSSDNEFAFGLSGEQIGRLLSFGYNDDPENIEPHLSSSASEHISTSGPVEETETSPHIDGYEVIDKIAEAGQGQVWRALQQSTGRHVAIKIPRLGTVISERSRIRFEREIELVARLKHPNIARIYDSGMNHGQYYYIMDFVEGSNLDGYVRQKGLTHRQILELMRTICQAVQHAHQNGIIHRDLKPANIIVTKEGRPVIVDFGLAKGFLEEDQNLVVSMDGETVGTPAYMSPEQAAGHIDKVDARTDVYSLGVTLYTLLTDKNPHDLSGSRLEVMHRKAEQEVIRPRKLNPKISKDIEALLLKALDKDPDRRYSTAEGLAEDIDNFLKGEPLIAGPPTTIYRLKKFVRRHKSLVASLIAVFVVLTAGIIVSLVFALKAERQAQRSEAIANFLTQDVLGFAKDVIGRDATAMDLLDNATKKLDEGKFKEHPLTESSVRFRVGNLIKELGYARKAIPHLERVREINTQQHGKPGHVVLDYLALAYIHSGQLKKAETLFQQIIQEKEKSHKPLGADLYPWVKMYLAKVYNIQARYEESEHFCLETMNLEFPKGKAITTGTMVRLLRALADSYRAQGRYEEAEQMIFKALDIDKSDQKLPHEILAVLYLDQGRYRQAEAVFREVIEQHQRDLPGEGIHRYTLPMLSGLAAVYTRQERFAEAEPLFQDVRETQKEKLGDDHWETLKTLNDFGVLRREQQHYEEAESMLRQALDGRRLKLGEDHPACFESLHELAVLYKEQELYDKAEPLLRDAIEGRLEKLGNTHPYTQESIKSLIGLYEAWSKPEKAKEWQAKLPQIEAVRE
ncbi:MAG: protein kinase domain-containing protein [Planctomycetota bacterium]|jgi:serine/threonine protein kinase/lipopolysaccharide biosynthesis regulator YciM